MHNNTFRQPIGLESGASFYAIDMAAVWNALRLVSSSDKVRSFMGFLGCEAWDAGRQFIKGHPVSLVGLGGMPVVHTGDTPAQVGARVTDFVRGSRQTMETAAAFSYLNSGNAETGALYRKVVGLGHHSIAHTVSANIVVAGATVAVENEFNAQRDLIHSSRLTIARTAIQAKPAIVAPTQEAWQAARTITDAAADAISGLKEHVSGRDGHELCNNLFPAAKATAFMLTGSLRNFQKMTAQIEDAGKEQEYRAILGEIKGTLQALWPELYT